MANRWEILQKKLKDVGKTYKEPVAVKESSSQKKNYPEIYDVNENQLPELKNTKVGDSVKFIAEGEIRSTSKRNNDPTTYTIEVRKMAILKGGA